MQAKNIEKVRLWIGKKAPKPVFDFCVALRKIYKKIRMPETRKTYGSMNPDTTFFVVRLFPPATGFGANYLYVLGYLKYAYDRGYQPVVDMQNYNTLYTNDSPVDGCTNVWEYYFEQPIELSTGKRYSLAEVYQSKNVILADASMELHDMSCTKEVIEWQREMMKRVPFNKRTNQYIEAKCAKLLDKNKFLIGVPTRGSDVATRVIGHPIPLRDEELIPYVKQEIEKLTPSLNGREISIYVSGEEKASIESMTKLSKNVCFLERDRIEKQGDAPVSSAFKVSKYQSTLDYLCEIRMLSLCDAIMGTINNGLYIALLWNDGQYKDVNIIDNGFYK